ncbi:MAG: hypothetical protein CVU90_00425 [Firmicutes bacterium HGW-Firmicutes-15]|nr:MAG: hypothetical protein CVU90_00425 [Firmicutes bacterium HGW-Firmicutes-15]
MDNEKLMKISELAKITGVSKQAIHFYLREGILSPPVKTSKNMAYYGPGHMKDIQLIRELKEKRYLPLAVIKMILEARRKGADYSAPDHLEFMEKLFASAPAEETSQSISEYELIIESHLPLNEIERLEELKLLTPLNSTEGKRYDDLDASIARLAGKLMKMGMSPEDLILYCKLLDLFRTEAGIIHDKVIHVSGRRHPPILEVGDTLQNLHLMLAKKAGRELFLEHPHQFEDKEGGQRND